MEAVLSKIKKNAPLGFKEFETFMKKDFEGLFVFHRLTIESMPYEMLLGFFIVFFESNDIDFSIADTNKEIILHTIAETFQEFEKVIGHYS